jgi:drug/metabolite transporter (DMT)-like permease
MREVTTSHAAVHAGLFATAIVWGLNVSAVKALTEHVDVMLVASLRTVLAALALSLLLLTRDRASLRWSLRFMGLALLGAALMVYANQTLFANAIQRTTATNAALIMALAPLVSALLETVLFRKTLGIRQLAGILVALSGVTVVILKGRGGEWSTAVTGDALMLASIVAFAAGGATVQRLSRCASPIDLTWLVHVAGASMLAVHTLFSMRDPWESIVALSGWHWLLMLYSGVLATAAGAIAWGRGIAAIGVGRTATYLSWVPLFGVGFGALLFDEPLNRWHAIGLAALLLGTAMATRGAGGATPDPRAA